MKRFFHENGLSVVLLMAFLVFWAAQSVTGYQVYKKEQHLHGQSEQGYTSYLTSGHFWQATGENWESEFLQMGAYVILTTYLFQRGSAESHSPDEAEKLTRAPKQPGELALSQFTLAGLPRFIYPVIHHPCRRWLAGIQ